MAREEFQAALDDLQTEVVSMGDLVADHLADGRRAFVERDEALARSVLEGDERVNERYLELEAECIDLFALQHPVASDLRIVAASFKIVTDLERIGDLAANLGEYALGAADEPLAEIDVDGIATAAERQVRDAVEAYADGDAAACRAVADRDDGLDATCRRAGETVVRAAIERSDGDAWAAERTLAEVSRLLLTVRDLERVGDHAVNVAGRTLYVAENDPELIY